MKLAAFFRPKNTNEEGNRLACGNGVRSRAGVGFLFSLVLSMGLVWLIHTKVPVRFAINDDCAFNLMLSGAYGTRSGYDIFQNIVFGKLISALYAVFPAVNWYSVVLLGIFCLSFAVFGALLIDKLGFAAGVPLEIAVDLVFETSMLYLFQWTVCAYLSMAAGIALFIRGDRAGRGKKTGAFILAGLFLSAAFMVRWNVILPAAALAGAYCAVALFERKKKALSSLIAFCAIGAAVAGLYGVNALAYSRDPQWRAYVEYNAVRSELVDFLRPEYADNQAVYQSVGWSENDCNLFLSFVTPDDGKFSTENLKKIAAAVDSGRSVRLKEAAVSLLKDIRQYRHTLIACFVILFSLLFGLCFNRNKILPIGLAASAFLFHLAFILMGRDIDRVVYPQYAVTAMLMLYILDFDAAEEKLGIVPEKLGRKTRVRVFALLAALSLLLPYSYVTDQTDAARSAFQAASGNSSIAQYDRFVREHPEDIFVMAPNGLYPRNDYYSVLTVPEKDSLINAFPLGGWEQRTKYYEEFEQRSGIENIVQDLLTKDNYYIAPLNYGDLLCTYIYENYGVSVEFQPVYQAGDIQICKVVKLA